MGKLFLILSVIALLATLIGAGADNPAEVYPVIWLGWFTILAFVGVLRCAGKFIRWIFRP